MKKIKIAIADDFTIYRDGLRVGLSRDSNFDVILEAADGEDLLRGMEENIRT